MEDNYSHIDDKIIYVFENVPGPSENSQEYYKIVDNYNSQLTHKCNCINVCEPSKCICINISGGKNYDNSTDHLILKLNKDKVKDSVINPIIECNDLCSCSVECGNRLVQKGPLKNLYVKTCLNNKGYGLFTTNLISKHTFICEYAGEIITKSQAEIRHNMNTVNRRMNYIFCLNEHSSNDVISQTFIDPSEFGNVGRYANHSCDPNCMIMPVRVNCPIPKLALFSCRDIPPDTEITFNYGSHYSENVLPVNGKQTKCLCNTKICTGWMPYQVY